jgi:hypothetical protein
LIGKKKIVPPWMKMLADSLKTIPGEEADEEFINRLIKVNNDDGDEDRSDDGDEDRSDDGEGDDEQK